MREITCGSTLRPEVRPAVKEDLQSLLTLENICFKEETFKKKQLTYLLLKAKSLVFVVSINSNIKGSMIILLRKNISVARIYSLNIHPDFRRRGLADLLMETSEKLLKEMGFKKITLEVGVQNQAAQNLYKSKGFSIDKVLRTYYENGEDALHLTKIL